MLMLEKLLKDMFLGSEDDFEPDEEVFVAKIKIYEKNMPEIEDPDPDVFVELQVCIGAWKEEPNIKLIKFNHLIGPFELFDQIYKKFTEYVRLVEEEDIMGKSKKGKKN